MSYESRILRELKMPTKENVMRVLLVSLLRYGGTVKEFGSGDQQFADEIADDLDLSVAQRTTTMQTLVRKEDRIKRFPAWNRLLFRAADLAARREFLSRPTDTAKLTGKREWMLSEKGIDKALRLEGIPTSQKPSLAVKTFEVQKVKKKLVDALKPENYEPIDSTKKRGMVTRESLIRTRGFREAIIEVYDFSCAVCGLRLQSPNFLGWEVEAAHIVPHRFRGRDDIWNGIALCHLHHWAFDAGWFTLRLDFTLEVSEKIDVLPKDQGRVENYDLMRAMKRRTLKVAIPTESNIQPHKNAILWHRQNIFCSV